MAQLLLFSGVIFAGFGSLFIYFGKRYEYIANLIRITPTIQVHQVAKILENSQETPFVKITGQTVYKGDPLKLNGISDNVVFHRKSVYAKRAYITGGFSQALYSTADHGAKCWGIDDKTQGQQNFIEVPQEIKLLNEDLELISETQTPHNPIFLSAIFYIPFEFLTQERVLPTQSNLKLMGRVKKGQDGLILVPSKEILSLTPNPIIATTRNEELVVRNFEDQAFTHKITGGGLFAVGLGLIISSFCVKRNSDND